MDPSARSISIRWRHIDHAGVRVVICLVAVCAIMAALSVIHVQHDHVLSAALNLFLVVVLIASIQWGTRYAIFLSLLSALAFSWLLPPSGHFHFDDIRTWTLLVACLLTGIIASQLSGRARRAALNANQRRAEAVAEQQRFRDLVDSVEGIVWEANAQTYAFSFVSEQAERVLGYPTDRWVNEPTFWKDHLHPEDRDLAVKFRLQASTQERSHEFEYRMIAADGRVVWIRDLVTAVVDNGRATRLRGVTVDVTKRKENEEALREQAGLLSLTHDAVLVRDSNRKITYWNRGAEELYGWRAEEAKGQVPYDLLKTDFPMPLQEIEAEVMRTGRWVGELVQTRKDGAVVVVASRWSLQRDDKGAPVAILVTNNDISDRKQAEQAREEIEEQWRAAFASNPTMYFIVDAAGVIVSVNTFGAEQLGYNVDELIGLPVLAVFYEPDRAAVQDHANTCFQQPGRMMRWEARKIRKDGRMIWVRETANAVFLKKRPVLLVVCEDITEQKRAEDAARRSENQLRNVIDTIPAMAWTSLPDGANTFSSRQWTDYTGLGVDGNAGSGWATAIHSDDLERHVQKWQTSLASGRPFENEVRIRGVADGEYRWFLARAIPLRDETGTILNWYGILTDIEDRKRAERALRDSEELKRRIIESSPDCIKVLDLDGNLLYMSSGGQQLLEIDDIQLYLDGCWVDFWQSEDRPKVSEAVAAARAGGIGKFQAFCASAKGAPRWWDVVVTPICDPDGRPEQLLSVSRDITDRKRAEEEVRAADTRFRTFVDHATDALFVHDEQGNIVEVNRQACEGLGYTRQELIGASPGIYDPGADAVFHQWVRERLETGGVCTFEASHRRKDGTAFPVEVRLRPFTHGGRQFALALVRDITNAKHAEAERERLRQLEADLARINRVTTMGELTASLAHEINQPIAATVTNANTSVRWLAGEFPNIEEAREAAKRAANDANRAAEIINRIRSLFRKGAPQRELVDVNQVIDEMVVMLLPTEADRSGVTISSELTADLPGIMADRVQLQQVVLNLMVNGIDAMKGIEGTRALTVASHRNGNGELVVSVSDTGVGLPADGGKVFDPFFTTKPHGTGMGLAISRTIIEAHGGRLWASSNSGGGATFFFTLPINTEADG